MRKLVFSLLATAALFFIYMKTTPKDNKIDLFIGTFCVIIGAYELTHHKICANCKHNHGLILFSSAINCENCKYCLSCGEHINIGPEPLLYCEKCKSCLICEENEKCECWYE